VERRTAKEYGATESPRPRAARFARASTRSSMPLGVLTVYGSAVALTVAVAVGCGQELLTTSSWVDLSGAAAVGWSVVLGALLGAATVLVTRIAVRRARWARTLHGELRPAVRDAGTGALLIMAVASGVGEELLFRGLLMPLFGVVASSIAFGLVHQVRGPARWIWVAWASVMGLLFALIFRLTGSLAGPIVAHVLVNGANLRFLRDTEVGAEPRPSGRARGRGLGGLLDRA
jgi:membrane protease YdiL (CAAX protease family)